MSSKNTLFFSKGALRREFLNMREKIRPRTLTKKSRVIQEAVLNMERVKLAQNVGLYIDVNHEVKTDFLIDSLMLKNKNIFLPKYKNGEWFYARFGGWSEIENGPFMIGQPKGDDKIKISELDLAVLAGVAFSRTGQRLGYGKGVYDKMFQNFEVFKVGLAFDFQIVDKLPQEDHDLNLDLIISNREIIKISI